VICAGARLRRCLLAFACSGFVLLPGCSDSDYDPVLEQWESRDELPGCGSLKLDQGESLTSEGKTEIACLRKALASGQGAELRVRYPTVEGDLITEYFRVSSAGTTEVYTDASDDENSDQAWHFASCAHPETALDVNC